ncbi:MAG: ribonuclease HII [Flavobacterium sp.]|nr:ribonuclease HII [Flavobacterium sp.]
MLKLRYSNLQFECGTDEAGRGCLAGPVVAAALIWTDCAPTSSHDFNTINDSKQISEKTRERLTVFIKNNACSYSICSVKPAVIDKINILNASILSMQKAILKLNPTPPYIIVDGNRFSAVSPLQSLKQINAQEGVFKGIPYTTIIKGDSLFLSIAAASILAKTYRDAYMTKIHNEYPMYNWKKNKGYPTKEHRAAILKYGITKYHRMSFNLRPKS